MNQTLPSRMVSSRLGLVAACLLAVPMAHASLLVYEGFDYAAGSLGTTTTPNASTIGLDTATAYAGTLTNFTVQSASLSLGSLVTSGGSVSFANATGPTFATAAAKISLANPYSGTLWSSYLVNLTLKGNGNDATFIRVADNTGNLNQRFHTAADSTSSSANIASNYSGGNVNGGDGLTLNTTYILITRFTNVGVALSETTQGVANVWALNEAQFEAFVAGGRSESYLDGGSVAAGTFTATVSSTATSGTHVFQNGNYFQFVGDRVGAAGTFDEIRWGSSLDSVTPVPEPSAFALLAGIATLGFIGLRRRR